MAAETPLMKPRHIRTGTWTTFERRFQPVEAPAGSLLHDHEDLPSDADPRLVWTIVEADGRLYVTPGWRIVNRIGYVLCTAPWTDDDCNQPDYRYD